jgi:hypothetical protein
MHPCQGLPLSLSAAIPNPICPSNLIVMPCTQAMAEATNLKRFQAHRNVCTLREVVASDASTSLVIDHYPYCLKVGNLARVT